MHIYIYIFFFFFFWGGGWGWGVGGGVCQDRVAVKHLPCKDKDMGSNPAAAINEK